MHSKVPSRQIFGSCDIYKQEKMCNGHPADVNKVFWCVF